MDKIRVGVLGAYRGTSMINYCKVSDNAKVVAICDKWVEGLNKQKEILNDDSIAYFTDFNEFIKYDMDAVVLANYANEHAPFAIKAMNEGKHVFSEVLPCQTLKEAVELIETVEKTGKIYAYGENYCYMPAPYEMKKLYKQGLIGEFEYGEGEYLHNCHDIWHSISYGDKNHWRNNMYSTFYCTHSLGPIIHITGLRPVSVTGFESLKNARSLEVGKKSGQFGIEIVTLSNGGIIKSIHGGTHEDNIWYTVYGSEGRMESERESTERGAMTRINLTGKKFTGEKSYFPYKDIDPKYMVFGHAGSDYFSMYNFIEKIKGNPEADIIDVYEALDMSLPGIFAYRSILKGGESVKIPNLRNKAERDLYRNDIACTDPKVAKDQLLPTLSIGTPEILDEVYENMKRKWLKEFEANEGYTKAAFHQSEQKK